MPHRQHRVVARQPSNAHAPVQLIPSIAAASVSGPASRSSSPVQRSAVCVLWCIGSRLRALELAAGERGKTEEPVGDEPQADEGDDDHTPWLESEPSQCTVESGRFADRE